MRRLFWFLLLLFIPCQVVDACAVCKLQTPAVHVTVSQQHSDHEMQLRINWVFSEYFSAETKLTYDENKNNQLEQSEIDAIHQSFIEYLEGEHYVTYLKYIDQEADYETEPHLSFEVSDQSTAFEDKVLRFSYTVSVPLEPQEHHLCYLSFFDQSNFFNFTITGITHANPENNTTVMVNNSASFMLGNGQAANTTQLEMMEESQIEYQEDGFIGFLTRQMKALQEALTGLLESIEEEGSLLSYFWLLLFSLLYGMVHAMGPGHGKSLVAAYFLGNNRSVFKAFSIASLIAVVHTFSAFILTVTVYYILNAYLSEYFDDVEEITTKLSALVIIAIALYLIYKKIPKKQKVTPQWSTSNPTQHTASCGCGACKSTGSDIGVILSAGIIPCPGTITIFVFAISYGMYSVGFLSAVFMSIGMSLVIFGAAVISIKVRQTASTHTKIRTLLDYGSLFFILTLGVLLLLAS